VRKEDRVAAPGSTRGRIGLDRGSRRRGRTIDEDRATAGARRRRSCAFIVVCGAGASSTFVAHRIRRAAAARGLEVRATADERVPARPWRSPTRTCSSSAPTSVIASACCVNAPQRHPCRSPSSPRPRPLAADGGSPRRRPRVRWGTVMSPRAPRAVVPTRSLRAIW
jgi:hypothetical protein